MKKMLKMLAVIVALILSPSVSWSASILDLGGPSPRPLLITAMNGNPAVVMPRGVGMGMGMVRTALVFDVVSPGGVATLGGGGGGATYPVSDAAFSVSGSADATKLFNVEVDGKTTGTTSTFSFSGGAQTVTVPATSFTVAGLELNQTFTLGLVIANSQNLTFAATEQGLISPRASQTPDSVFLATGTLSNAWILAEALDMGFDFAHPQQTNPTLFGQSAAQSTTQWWSLTHNQTNVVAGAGLGVWTFPQGLQNTAGRSTLAADFTSIDATVANTALSVTVTTGRKYTFVLKAFFTNTTAADGIRIDFDGGTATATNFRAHCLVSDTALLLSSQVTALATDVVVTSATGASFIDCSGSFEPSATGTFIVRAAEEADGGGTLTVNRGSFLWVEDTP